MRKPEKATIIGIILNSVLFVAKFIVGLISGSLAVLSDAFNSLTDIITSIGIFIAVRVSDKKADTDHPYGHRRAEPIAGLITAVFAGILGFEVIKEAVVWLFTETRIIIGIYPIIVLLFTIIVKSFMSVYFISLGKRMDRPAIRASGIDSRNDVLVSAVALAGVVGAYFGFGFFDSISAIIIGIFILYSGCYKIGIENIDYLMGKAPPAKDIHKIMKAALSVEGVTGIHDVKVHYVGNFVHAEVHVEVDKDMKTKKSHDIGKCVQNKIEALHFVEKAFIHIDPV